MHFSIPDNTLEKFSTFGDLLRFLRRRAGITQLELSIAVGYSDAQISRLEQNLRPPDIPTIEARFVSALGLEDEPKVVARLLDLATHVRREDAPGLGLCPYKGLNYFDESDSDLYVGREKLAEKLVGRVISLASNESPEQTRFLAVVGASGSGKSSLVRAGIVPALRWNKNSADWQIQILTPTAHPLESLATSLTDENEPISAVTTLMDDLAHDTRSLQIFAKRYLSSNSGSHLLLVIDQFEELFALCRSEEEKSAFIGNLLSAVSEAEGLTIVLIALRADFYAHCANYIQLREALAKNQEYIGTMRDEELQRAIEEPARRGRWEFEPGLVELLLRDISHEPGALPLLSHALLETWQRRRGRVMTLSGYTSSGGVQSAIAETAESVFKDRLTPDQQEVVRHIFLRLTELGDEATTGDTRRRATIDELILKPEETSITRTLLKVLADARLVVTSEDTVEVAHEALIREWPRLRGWLEDNRDSLRLHRRLTEAAQEWKALDCDPEMLYRGARLTEAQEWAATHQDELNELERTFLDASISSAEREAIEREAQRQRELEAAQKLAESEKQRAEQQTSFARQMSIRARFLTGAFIIAVIMALTALFFGSQARQTAVSAQNDRRIATARELSAASINNINVDPERSILLALQAISTTRSVDGTILPESIEALHRSVVTSPIRMTLLDHQTRVLSADYSPDGTQLATIGDNGTVILWNANTGEELLRLPGSTQPNDLVTPNRVAYSPDGKLLAACDSNKIDIYDPATGNLIQTLEGHKSDVTAVAYSRDGNYLASGGVDGSLLIWNIQGGNIIAQLAGHTDAVEGLAFSPDGKWLITSSEDTTMKIWDAATGELLRDFTEFTDLVDTVTFSPDGSKFAFSNGAIHIWKLNSSSSEGKTTITSEEILNIPGGVSITFSPDGTKLATAWGTAASGNGIALWDANSGRELLTMTGHSGWVMGLAFSPDGKRLASTSLDGTVRIWSIGPGQEMVTVSSPATGYGNRVVYSPTGQEFATNGGDGSATIWNATTGEPRLTLRGHNLEVMNMAFSPDGKRFATGSLDATAIVWDAATGKKLLTLLGHEIGVRDIAFSPDGTLIATGGFDKTARVWEAASGKQLLKITGHNGLVAGVAFSPDGTRLATSSTDATAKVWDIKTGDLLLTLTGHSGGVTDIAYSPDGKKIATVSSDMTAKIWEAATGKELLTLIGHSAGLRPVAFSPDGNLLATGSGDNTAKIWDVETGQEILTLPGNQGGVYGVAFSPADGGSHLAVASNDGVVRIFLLRIDDLVALAHSRVTRPLTIQECKRYLHVTTCPDTL
jgi:WD40 repeat protein